MEFTMLTQLRIATAHSPTGKRGLHPFSIWPLSVVRYCGQRGQPFFQRPLFPVDDGFFPTSKATRLEYMRGRRDATALR
jgi:hypothetical protein